jgi:hypothetical protein
MQEVAKIYQFAGHAYARAFSCANVIQPIEQFFIEVGITPEIAVDLGSILKKTGQDILKILNRKRVIRVELLYGALKPRAFSVPHLLRSITLSTKQKKFATGSTRCENGYRFRFVEPSEIKEVAVGSIAIMDVAVSR